MNGSSPVTRFAGLLSMAALLALATVGCNDDGDADEGDGGTAASPAASGCDEVNALEDSLTALTQVDPVSDGTDALQSAVTEVRTDLDAAASAVASELQPAVDDVSTAFGDLETALEGVTSEDGLGAAATEVGNALSELGTALTGLSSEITETC